MAEKGDRNRTFRASSGEAERPACDDPGACRPRRLYINSGKDKSADQQQATVQSQAPDHFD
jgi:hypothetical protein